MSTQPTPTTWRVTRINQDTAHVEVTLTATEWSIPDDPDSEDADLFPATPGQPGAFWDSPDKSWTTTLYFNHDEGRQFTIGQHYVMGLTEIVDAPSEQYQPA